MCSSRATGPTRFLFTLAGVLVMLGGCHRSCERDATGVDSDFADVPLMEESRDTWEDWKATHGDSYRWSSCGSTMMGTVMRTTVVVEDGEVTERHFDHWRGPGADSEVTPSSWTETGDELGSHDEGEDPRTMDELYSWCFDEYLVLPEDENSFHVQTFESGLIKMCGVFPHGCADACYQGVSLETIEAL